MAACTVRYNPATDTRPAPAAGYTDGSELARVQTRHNLHRLDAAIDGGSAGAGWLTAEIESILRSLAGSEKNRLHTPAWKRIFILVCDDSTIVDAVTDLGVPQPIRSQWIEEERSWF